MKVVILAGGYGTRISEESHLKPKPMIEIGDKPILWHIMKHYSQQGFNEFVICLGYKGYVIKEYFANYYLHQSDVTFDFSSGNTITQHNNTAEPWKVTLVDTGLNTMTGGRVKRIKDYIGNEPFMLTYGDGVSNVNYQDLIKFHKEKKSMVTITTIQPEGRFGVVDTNDAMQVQQFRQKSQEDSGWINGGFMVIEPEFLDLIEGDGTVLEKEPFDQVVDQGRLFTYRHSGFWQCMDTMRDKIYLDECWASNKAPWKDW
jgi:glucose-1-phosphate cytidylyltransferase